MIKLDAGHVLSVVQVFRMVNDGCDEDSEDDQFNELNQWLTALMYWQYQV